MRFLFSECIFPITEEPIYEHVVVVEDDFTIADILPTKSVKNQKKIEYFSGGFCPGFVNTHCHLELSWAHNLIEKHCGLDSFIKKLEKLKNEVSEKEKLSAAQKAIESARSTGTVAICDITNTTLVSEICKDYNLDFHHFIEIFESDSKKKDLALQKAFQINEDFQNCAHSSSITPHAPYSVSNELLTEISKLKNNKISIHLFENEDENDYFLHGEGKIVERRKFFGLKNIENKINGKRSLQSVAEFLKTNENILFVHNTVAKKEDIDFAKENFENIFWCFCVNSNMFIERQYPDIQLFVDNDCKITLGTDSLASNKCLSIAEEIFTIMNIYPKLNFNNVLKWATKNGAEFMNLEHKIGSFEIGKKPGIVCLEDWDSQDQKLKSPKAFLIE